MKTSQKIVSLAVLAALALAVFDAEAAGIRVRCEKRADRSKVSVDGRGLSPGDYSAVALSGSNQAQTPDQPASGGEAEFDFNSQRNDIAAGATAIPRNFIVNGTVTGKILDQDGMTVISDTVRCRVRR